MLHVPATIHVINPTIHCNPTGLLVELDISIIGAQSFWFLESLTQLLRYNAQVYHALKSVIKKKYGQVLLLVRVCATEYNTAAPPWCTLPR